MKDEKKQVEVGTFWKENWIMEHEEVLVVAHVGVDNVAVMHPEGNYYSSWYIKCFLRNHTQVADAEGTPLVKYKVLDWKRKLKRRPIILRDDGSVEEAIDDVRLLKEICALSYRYPDIPENADELIYEPEPSCGGPQEARCEPGCSECGTPREKYFLYPVFRPESGILGIRFDEHTAYDVGEFGAHSGAQHDGRYCIGYTDNKEWPAFGGSIYRMMIGPTGDYRAYAIFADPNINE